MADRLKDIAVPVSRIGGHPAVDLLNTVDWRLWPGRRHDRLREYRDVLVWARTLELLTHHEADQLAALAAADLQAAAGEYERIIAVREDLYEALTERRPPHLAIDAYRDSLARSSLVPVDDDDWQWQDRALTLATPRDRIAHQVLDVFRHPKIGRFHRCEGDGCGWVYIDTSPRGDRRWCSSGDCGNRDRARRYYRRTRQQTDAR
jgi:predicted RNA-binding Zn ribbon-like protein